MTQADLKSNQHRRNIPKRLENDYCYMDLQELFTIEAKKVCHVRKEYQCLNYPIEYMIKFVFKILGLNSNKHE